MVDALAAAPAAAALLAAAPGQQGRRFEGPNSTSLRDLRRPRSTLATCGEPSAWVVKEVGASLEALVLRSDTIIQ